METKETAIKEKPLRRVLFESRRTETKSGRQVNIEGELSDSRAKCTKFTLESAWRPTPELWRRVCDCTAPPSPWKWSHRSGDRVRSDSLIFLWMRWVCWQCGAWLTLHPPHGSRACTALLLRIFYHASRRRTSKTEAVIPKSLGHSLFWGIRLRGIASGWVFIFTGLC